MSCDNEKVGYRLQKKTKTTNRKTDSEGVDQSRSQMKTHAE